MALHGQCWVPRGAGVGGGVDRTSRCLGLLGSDGMGCVEMADGMEAPYFWLASARRRRDEIGKRIGQECEES